MQYPYSLPQVLMSEWTGLMMIRAYHESRRETRTKVIVPDSSHGTNPASASAAGLETITIPSTDKGMVDLEALKAAVGSDTAALMLTNPSTLGLFETQIVEIAEIVHEAGAYSITMEPTPMPLWALPALATWALTLYI